MNEDPRDPPPPVGRLAPSPTGLLHLGHARTFLLAWWHVRARAGRVLLRIEDLDRARSRPELVEACLRDLEWLGLDWDGEPHLQSADTSAYAQAVERLLERGQAYACTCSRREIERALGAPHASDGERRYPGTCRGRYASLAEAERAWGAAVGIRLRVPVGELALEDGCAGRVRFDVQRAVGDFLLARRDGAYAYQLAVVVDDARSGVTEVLRGDDLLPSAARQAHLQDALGLPRPRWFHVPLVLDGQGERLAKRRADTTLAELRAAGVDPRALVAWAARSAGQSCPERALAREVLSSFDLGRLPRAPVRCGPGELERLRGQR
jgi:glutamyl-tRNA synthetase